MYIFFFSSRRRHTRYWRDWSSDVCSSDLISTRPVEPLTRTRSPVLIRRVGSEGPTTAGMPNSRETTAGCEAMPPASVDRESVLEGKRVDIGGRRIIKKKKDGLRIIKKTNA